MCLFQGGCPRAGCAGRFWSGCVSVGTNVSGQVSPVVQTSVLCVRVSPGDCVSLCHCVSGCVSLSHAGVPESVTLCLPRCLCVSVMCLPVSVWVSVCVYDSGCLRMSASVRVHRGEGCGRVPGQ